MGTGYLRFLTFTVRMELDEEGGISFWTAPAPATPEPDRKTEDWQERWRQ